VTYVTMRRTNYFATVRHKFSAAAKNLQISVGSASPENIS